MDGLVGGSPLRLELVAWCCVVSNAASELIISPLVSKLLQKYRQIPAEEIGVRVTAPKEPAGLLSLWEVEARTGTGQTQRSMVALAIDANGQRILPWERRPDTVWTMPDSQTESTLADLRSTMETQLHQELRHRGLIQETNDYDARLVGWLEVGV